jgi:hypothetical protein
MEPSLALRGLEQSLPEWQVLVMRRTNEADLEAISRFERGGAVDPNLTSALEAVTVSVRTYFEGTTWLRAPVSAFVPIR